MFRHLSKTLTSKFSLLPPAARLIPHRRSSDIPPPPPPPEADLEQEPPAAPPPPPSPDSERDRMKRLMQEEIHGFIAWRSAPDWLPFIPGSSYWVPPIEMMGGVILPTMRVRGAFHDLQRSTHPLFGWQEGSTRPLFGWQEGQVESDPEEDTLESEGDTRESDESDDGMDSELEQV